MNKTKCDSVNHTRLPARGSPTRLSTSGRQSYKGWSCRLHLTFWLTWWRSDSQERLYWKESVICFPSLFIYRPFQGRDTNVGNSGGVTWDALVIVLICSFVVSQLELGCWEELRFYTTKWGGTRSQAKFFITLSYKGFGPDLLVYLDLYFILNILLEVTESIEICGICVLAKRKWRKLASVLNKLASH